MRVAFVAPPHNPIPSHEGYGGISRDVHELAEYFTTAGHDVTLLCSGDSDPDIPGVEVVPIVEKSIGKQALSDTEYREAISEAENAIVSIAPWLDVDIINLRWERYKVAAYLGCFAIPLVTSFSCGPDEQTESILSDRFVERVFTAHTHAQKRALGNYNDITVLPCGVRMDTVTPSLDALTETTEIPSLDLLRALQADGRDYLTQIALVRPTKGQATAIDIAKQVNIPIVLAGAPKPSKPDSVSYLNDVILPQVDDHNVYFLGEVDETQKYELMRYARATIFCSGIETPFVEAFGRVLAESTAVGTPVLGYRSGSFPEVIENQGIGLGFDNVDEAVAQVGNIDEINRAQCAEQARRTLSSSQLVPRILRFCESVVDTRSRDRALTI